MIARDAIMAARCGRVGGWWLLAAGDEWPDREKKNKKKQRESRCKVPMNTP